MPLDIGIGILGAIGISRSFGLPLTAELVVGGIIFALLADADLLWHLIRGGTMKNGHRHRDLLHYPILFIPVGCVAVYFVGGLPWAALFFTTSLAHFLHDSIGIGWGVAWLWPFNTHRYSFLYVFQPRHRKPMPRQLVYVWPDHKIDELEREFGDPDFMTHVYWQLHPYAIVEFLLLLLSIGLLVFYAG